MAQMGMAEFFAMEAGDYLERLDGLISKASSPDIQEFVRLTRALRGSALMANQQSMATAAGGLEAVARALRDLRLTWDPAVKQIAVRAVDDLKILIRKVPSWTPAEDARARGIAAELEHVAGTPALGASAPRPAISVEPDAGTRAFVARESSSLASVLDRSAQIVAQGPQPAREHIQTLLKAMQPLRGLASLSDLAPLPDLLEGIERLAGEIARGNPESGEAAQVFGIGAKALSRIGREVATAGKPQPDTPEFAEFARRLTALLDREHDVVPIDTLFFSDGPHIVQQGTPPKRGGELSRVELVAHGEHLRQAADALERAQSPTQRALRAHGLTATFRTLSAAGNDSLAAFARAALDAITRGLAADDPRFAAELRNAGVLLSGASGGGDQELTAIAQVIRELGVAGAVQASAAASVVATPQPTPAAPTPTPTPTPPPESPAREPVPPPHPAAVRSFTPPSTVAPVAATLAVPPTPPPPPPAAAPEPKQPAPSPAPAEETADLVGSFLRFERFRQALGTAPVAVGDLLAGPPRDPKTAAPPQEAVVVPIDDLCYRGPRALERALSLREKVRVALAEEPDGKHLDELFEEVFDLLKLGLESDA